MDDKAGARTLVDMVAALVGYAIITLTLIYYGGFEKHPLVLLKALKTFGMHWPFWMMITTLGGVGSSVLILVLNPFRNSSAYGGAEWATEKMIQNMDLRAETGVIIGMKNGRYLRVDKALSCFIYAPPGSGKTAGIIIPTLLSTGNSTITHDPKGELYNKTAPHRAKFSKVLKFAPGDRESAGWNPLAKRELPEEWDDIVVTVDRLCKSFITTGDPEKDKSDHWVKEARSLFMFWALYQIHCDGETSLPAVRKANASCQNVQDALAEILDNDSAYENIDAEEEGVPAHVKLPSRIIEEANRQISKAEKEFSSVVSTFSGYLDIFGDPKVADNMSRSDFSLSDLRHECTSLYLCVRASDQGRLKPVLSMFFEYCALTYLHEEPKPEEQTITMLLDEFVRLARMKEILEMPAISRSYRCNVLFVCQSQSQVKGLYGQEGLDQLINTCAYLIVFSQNEVNVAEQVSKSIGPRTRKKISYSGQQGAFTRNQSESEEGVPLVLPQDVMSQGFGEIIILVQNHFKNPIKAKVPMWFWDKAQKAVINLRDFETIEELNHESP